MDFPNDRHFNMAAPSSCSQQDMMRIQSADSFASSSGTSASSSGLSVMANGPSISVSGRLPVLGKSQLVFVRGRGGSNLGPTCLDVRTSPLGDPSSRHAMAMPYDWVGNPSADGTESDTGLSFSIDARLGFPSPSPTSRQPDVSKVISPSTAGTAITCQNGQISLSPVYRRPMQSANFSFVLNTEGADSGNWSKNTATPSPTPGNIQNGALPSRDADGHGTNSGANDMANCTDLSLLLESADVAPSVSQVACSALLVNQQSPGSPPSAEHPIISTPSNPCQSDLLLQQEHTIASQSKSPPSSAFLIHQTLKSLGSNDEEEESATLAECPALPRDEGGSNELATSSSSEEVESCSEEESEDCSSATCDIEVSDTAGVSEDVSTSSSETDDHSEISRSSGGFTKEQLSSCSRPVKKKKRKKTPSPPPPPPDKPPPDCSCPPFKPCPPQQAVPCQPPEPCDTACPPSKDGDNEEKFTPATKLYFQAKYALQQIASLKRENMYLREETDEWNDAMRADGWDDMVFIRLKAKNRSSFPGAPPKEAVAPDTVPAMSYKTVLNLAGVAKLEQEIENRKLTKAIVQSQMESLKRRKERRQNKFPMLEDAYEYYFDAQINGIRQIKELEETFNDLEKKFVEAIKLLQAVPRKWEEKKELKQALELLKDFLRSGAPLDATTLPMLEILNPYLKDTKLLNMLFKRIDHSDIPGRDKPWSPYERGLSAIGPRRLVARRETETPSSVPFLQKEWHKTSLRAAVQITDGLADIKELTKKIKALTMEDCQRKNFKETFKNTLVSK